MTAPRTEAEWRAQPGPWAHLTKEQTDELLEAWAKKRTSDLLQELIVWCETNVANYGERSCMQRHLRSLQQR